MIDHAASVQIGGQRHRLADAHRRQLRLLEVGVDPHLIERHDGHQREARAHALAELHVALGDEAGDRCRQYRARVGQIGAAHLCGGVAYVGMILDSRAVRAGAAGAQLLLGGQQRGGGAACRIARVLQFFA